MNCCLRILIVVSVCFTSRAIAEEETATSGTLKNLNAYLLPLTYTLPLKKTSNQVRAIAISKSDGKVYTWYADSTVSTGTHANLGVHKPSYAFTRPPMKRAENLCAVGISSKDLVYAYWDDATYSVGHSWDLDAKLPPAPVKLPFGYGMQDLVALAFTPKNEAVAYWRDGRMSIGWYNDLGGTQPPQPFTLPPGKQPTDIIGIGIATNGRTYTWYHGLHIGAGHPYIEATIDAQVVTWLQDNKIPGATVAITKGGRLVFDKGYGYADIEQRVHMKPFHRSRVGSISKVITTLGIMHHANQDDPQDYRFLDQKLYGPGGYADTPEIREAINDGILRYTPIVAMAVSKNDDHVYTWYDDGTYSVGISGNLTYYQPKHPYKLPPGKSPSDIRAVALTSADKTVVWFDDKTYSVGAPDRLYPEPDLEEEKPSSNPPSLSEDSVDMHTIVGMAAASDNRIYTFYENKTVSVGTYDDLKKFKDPYPYVLPAGREPYQIRGIGIAGSNDHVYVWYTDGTVSSGNSHNLELYKSPYAYTFPAESALAPAWRRWIRGITLRHLLTHTSGFERDGNIDSVAELLGIHRNQVTPWALHQHFWRSRRLHHQPGTYYLYANHGLILAGAVLAKATGSPYDAYIQEHIFKPLHLEVRSNNLPPTPLDAASHQFKDNVPVVAFYLSPPLGTPAGEWSLSAGDLMRLYLATDRLPNRMDLLPVAALAHMEARQYAQVKNRALGWGYEENKAGKVKLSHDGALLHGKADSAKFLQGYISLDGIDLSTVNIAICANIGGDYSFYPLINNLAKWVGASPIPATYDLY